MKQLEEMIEMKLTEIVFDSDRCDWSRYTTCLPELLNGKENVLIVVETDERKTFGGYVKQTISINEEIEDEESFFFSIEINKINN